MTIFVMLMRKMCIRVEGCDKAVITDVIYSSETSSEEEKPASEIKEKYDSIQVITVIMVGGGRLTCSRMKILKCQTIGGAKLLVHANCSY